MVAAICMYADAVEDGLDTASERIPLEGWRVHREDDESTRPDEVFRLTSTTVRSASVVFPGCLDRTSVRALVLHELSLPVRLRLATTRALFWGGGRIGAIESTGP